MNPNLLQLLWQKFTGISDSLWSGPPGSFYKFVGIDKDSNPGSITVHQALAKHSGATITELCKVGLGISDGSKLWFSYTSGKIWRESGGTYELVYTTAPAAGNAGCLGAREFNGNVYWGTESREHYIPVANIGSAASWTANAVPNWQTFTATDALYHPHEVQNNQLFIGDNYLVAKVDSSNSFTANALTIAKPNRVKCLAPLSIDLVVGTIIAATVNRCEIIRWDTVQTTWQFAEPVWENGVNAFLWQGSELWAQAGTAGMLYPYTGLRLDYRRRRQLQGTWSPTKTAEVWTNAVGLLKGRPIFGLSNITGNPADQAIYSLGSHSAGYPAGFGEDFPLSTGNFTGITIGAIVVDGTDVYVSWQDASTYGVDKLDYAAKYASAYLETVAINGAFLVKRALAPDVMNLTTFARLFANYQSLNSGSLVFKYYANHASVTTPTIAVVDDTNINQIYVEESIDARVLRMRIEFTVSGNNAPVVELVGVAVAATQ